MRFRCPECRTRRTDYGLFLQHLKLTGHRVCNCGGYHYPHRADSPYCHKNALAPYRHAARESTDKLMLLDIFIDCVWDASSKPVKPGTICPF